VARAQQAIREGWVAGRKQKQQRKAKETP